MKYYIISGEASGDLHGSRLIQALKNLDQNAKFRAWGGDLMEEEGAIIVKHYEELAFMGIWEVVSHLYTIIKNLFKCKKDILKFNPDVIIYIDYPGFNLRIAKWAKKRGFKNHYYISPQVWAWREDRVKRMKKILDALYVILPFEKSYYEVKHQFPVHFVGHPLTDLIKDFKKNYNFHESYKLDLKKPIIALLPGSRIQEITKLLPLYVNVAKHFKKYQFIIAGVSGIKKEIYSSIIKESTVKTVYSDTYNLLQNSKAAIVTSGTATLETALFGVPQLVCYKISFISYIIGKIIIKVKYISLVNLILDKPAVKELIQENCYLDNLIYSLENLIQKNTLKKINKDYNELKKILGVTGASKRTAELIFKSIK